MEGRSGGPRAVTSRRRKRKLLPGTPANLPVPHDLSVCYKYNSRHDTVSATGRGQRQLGEEEEEELCLLSGAGAPFLVFKSQSGISFGRKITCHSSRNLPLKILKICEMGTSKNYFSLGVFSRYFNNFEYKIHEIVMFKNISYQNIVSRFFNEIQKIEKIL